MCQAPPLDIGDYIVEKKKAICLYEAFSKIGKEILNKWFPNRP